LGLRKAHRKRRRYNDHALKNNNEKPMPLEGIRIIEFGIFVTGPGAASILGELGADVVKIESWLGDPARLQVNRIGKIPPLTFKNGESMYYRMTNCNKKAICIDVSKKKEERFSTG
jgi:crotonobetainyl-CoA:carnitine CoA-transferase CaiB-like acyl-CoA transferase